MIQSEVTQQISGALGPDEVPVKLRVNGREVGLRVDPRTTLLDLLREQLGLTGTKKGCNHGQCGACTILIDGRRANACLTLAVFYDGADLTTIEGLATGDTLQPMQAAFIARDAFQCGYCTPGQIISAIALLEEGAPTDDAILKGMSGNICRCGADPNIVDAIRDVRDGQDPRPLECGSADAPDLQEREEDSRRIRRHAG